MEKGSKKNKRLRPGEKPKTEDNRQQDAIVQAGEGKNFRKRLRRKPKGEEGKKGRKTLKAVGRLHGTVRDKQKEDLQTHASQTKQSERRESEGNGEEKHNREKDGETKSRSVLPKQR